MEDFFNNITEVFVKRRDI